MEGKAKILTYEAYLRNLTADRVDYKGYLSQLLASAFPFEIRYASDEHIREFVVWAVKEAYGQARRNIRVRKQEMRLTMSVEAASGMNLKKLVCNLILAGEGMSSNRLLRTK